MKSILLLILTISTSTFSFCQMAFVKSGFKKVSVYDSTKEKIIAAIDNETYFDCDTLIGSWYSISMPYVFDGFIHKDSLQFFEKLKIAEQKNRINKVLFKFYRICNEPYKEIISLTNGGRDTTYELPWESYYVRTFYPILEEFSNYYKKTKDTATLLNVLKAANCRPDGEFAETFDYIIGYCYSLNKDLFVRQIRRIKNKSERDKTENILQAGIFCFYSIKYGHSNKKSEDIERLVTKEQKIAENLLQ